MKRSHRYWAAIVLLLLASKPLTAAEPSAAATGVAAAIVPLTGEIDDYSKNDLIRRFEKAKALGAKVIVLEIDSPGGLVVPSLEISHFLKRQSDVHTVAFVRDKAYSGASMAALACDEVWMAPESALGDCAPIVLGVTGDLQPLPAAERAKKETPIVKDFEDSAQRNGFSPVLARAFVVVQESVYFVENSAGERRIVDEPEYRKLTADGKWKPVPGFDNPIDGPTTLLTVYPKEAMALGLVKGQASSAAQLVSQQGDQLIADLSPGLGEKLVVFLNNPWIRSLLLMIFLQALYIGLHAPGHGAAEAIAIVSLGLLLGVPLLTGYAQWWEVAVIFIGLGLCAFEIFVFPGHMVSLIVGSIMVVGGLILTFAGREPTGVPGWLPTMQQTWHGLQNGLEAVVAALVGWILLSMWLRRYLPAIPYFNRLILTATSGGKPRVAGGADRPPTEAWPFVGSAGVALTDLRPGGSVEFPYADSTRAASVVSISGYVPSGAKVVVDEVQGSSIRVRAVKEKEIV